MRLKTHLRRGIRTDRHEHLPLRDEEAGSPDVLTATSQSVSSGHLRRGGQKGRGHSPAVDVSVSNDAGA
jgi:hypothetical protein